MAILYRPALCLLALYLLAACGSKQEQATTPPPPSVQAVEVVYQEGRAAYEAGNYTEAIDKFVSVVQADPRHTNALVNWGAALSRSGNPEEAIKKYQLALLQDPDKAEAYYNWGVALERLGKHQEAVERYDQALALNVHLSTPALRRYIDRHRPQEQESRVKSPMPGVSPMTSPSYRR
jgi:tetratricopeptide (TPR) repeat protein